MRQIPFRDAYLRNSQNRNCAETKIRKDVFLTHQHVCSLLNLLLAGTSVTFSPKVNHSPRLNFL